MATADSDAVTDRVPPPDAPRSLDHADRVRIFGRFSWKLKPTPEMPEAIEIDPVWRRQNLVTVTIPWQGTVTAGKLYDQRRITVHRLAAGPVVALFEAWQAAGYLPLLQQWSGSQVSRMKRGRARSTNPADLSSHAWGTAFDVNFQWNPLGKNPAPIGAKGSLILLVPLAYEHGFAWGGDFKGDRVDGCHFELARVPPPPLPAGVV